jgi:hypothetical protein
MSPSVIRFVWDAVTAASAQQIAPLDDASLLNWVVNQVQQHLYLDQQQYSALVAYISDRLPLIRDLADQI